MNATNIYVVSTCLFPGSRCQTGAAQQFAAGTFNYSFDCAPHTFRWDFGDGSTITTGPIANHVYSTPGTYSVSVTASNPGQTFVAVAAVTIYGPGCPLMTAENVALTIDCSTRCGVGEPISFGATGTPYDFSCAPHSFTWTFGDGSPSLNSQSVTHTYSFAGNYTVALTIANSGQSFTTVKTISVAAPASARRDNLLGDAGRFGSPAALAQWTAHGSGFVSWSQDSAGDSGSGSAELNTTSEPTYISRIVPILPERSYIAQTLARNAGTGSCKARVSIWLLASPTGPRSGGRDGYTSDVTNQWSPADSIVGELIFAPPEARYAEVRLSGEPAGCTLHFSDAGLYQITPEIKSFTASSFDVPPGTPITLAWQTANATAVNAPDGFHPFYSDAGSTVVYPQTTTTYQLTARTDRVAGFGSLPANIWQRLLPSCITLLGGTDAASVTVHVTPSGDCPDLRRTGIAFDVAGAAAVGQPLTFQASMLSGETRFCSRNQLKWDFGDGSTATGSKVIHTYATPGSYLVLLGVTDSAEPSFTAFTSRNLTIGSGAIGTLSLSSLAIRAGEKATLTWYASVPAEVHTAPYGYLTDRTLQIGPLVAVSDSGSLQVAPAESTTYVVTGSGGTPVLDVVALYVNSSPPPSITFNATPASIRKGDPVSLTWQISGADCGTSFIDNGVGPTGYFDLFSGSGSTVVYPSTTTTYTITASGAGGLASKAVTITVDDAAAAGIRHLAGVAATSGAVNGPASTALFDHPAAAALDAQGNVYVVDAGNHAIRRIKNDGTVETYAGQLGVRGKANGYRTQATFDFTNFSGAFLVNPDGAMTVFDANGRRDISAAGDVTGGNCTSASCGRFIVVTGVLRAASGVEYWTDTNKHVIWQRLPSAANASIFAGTSDVPGFVDGRGNEARFNTPRAITIDSEGNLYVSDTRNQAIRKITPDARVTTYAGRTPDGSTVSKTSGDFSTGVCALVAGSGGVLYVVDPVTNSIKKVLPDGSILTMVGSGTAGSADGAGANGTLNDPAGITRDKNGTLVITDRGNHEIRSATDPVPPPCPAPDSTNTTIDYENASQTCGPGSNDCTTRDPILISLRAAGFAFSCAAHSFEWDFGDGTNSVSSSASQTHTYALPGTYTVRVTISRAGGSTAIVTRSLSIVELHGRRRSSRH